MPEYMKHFSTPICGERRKKISTFHIRCTYSRLFM